jgi:hypothetical protein
VTVLEAVKDHCLSDVGAEAEDTVSIFEIHWFLREVQTGAAEIVENREMNMIDFKSRVLTSTDYTFPLTISL